MADFWAVVHVQFREPVYDVDDPTETPAQGYYRNFGLRAAPDRVHHVLAAEVDDGVIDWEGSEWHYVEPDSLQRDLRKLAQPVTDEGIWYRSGRVIYADPDLMPEPS